MVANMTKLTADEILKVIADNGHYTYIDPIKNPDTDQILRDLMTDGLIVIEFSDPAGAVTVYGARNKVRAPDEETPTAKRAGSKRTKKLA